MFRTSVCSERVSSLVCVWVCIPAACVRNPSYNPSSSYDGDVCFCFVCSHVLSLSMCVCVCVGLCGCYTFAHESHEYSGGIICYLLIYAAVFAR